MMLFQGDALGIPLADRSVHCIVTSPPYWGLRKYTGVKKGIGLEPTIEEYIASILAVGRELWRILRDDGTLLLNLGDCYFGSGGEHSDGGGQSGLGVTGRAGKVGLQGSPRRYTERERDKRGLRDGNAAMIPHRVAIALQEDGWIVREDVVWYKPNPMPESVDGWRWQAEPCDCPKERREAYIASQPEGISRHRTVGAKPGEIGPDPDCPKCHGSGRIGEPVMRRASWRRTRAHEYVFLLVKRMGYFGDKEASRVAGKGWRDSAFDNPRDIERHPNVGRAARAGLSAPDYDERKWTDRSDGLSRPPMTMRDRKYNPAGRNPHSVMLLPTSRYERAHYATFPPELVEPLIASFCPRWSCPACGAPWAPVVEKGETTFNVAARDIVEGRGDGKAHHLSWGKQRPELLDSYDAAEEEIGKVVVRGYRPSCDHPHDVDQAVPGIVFDPFVGSGTVLAVARDMLRRGIGMDLSRPYLTDHAALRLGRTPAGALDDLPLFAKP